MKSSAPTPVFSPEKLRVIEGIEPFRTELNIHSFRRLEGLVHRHVEVGAVRHIQAVPA